MCAEVASGAVSALTKVPELSNSGENYTVNHKKCHFVFDYNSWLFLGRFLYFLYR